MNPSIDQPRELFRMPPDDLIAEVNRRLGLTTRQRNVDCCWRLGEALNYLGVALCVFVVLGASIPVRSIGLLLGLDLLLWALVSIESATLRSLRRDYIHAAFMAALKEVGYAERMH